MENVEGGMPENTDNTEGAGAPDVDGTAGAADSSERLASLEAQNQKLLDKIASLTDETIKHRKERNAERSNAAQAAEEAGRFEEALKLHREELEEAKGYKTEAEKWREYVSVQREAIAHEIEAGELPGYLKTALEAADDVLTQRKILDAYKAEQQKNAPPKKPAMTGAPAGSVKPDADWDHLNSIGGRALDDAIMRDRKGWRAFLMGNKGRKRVSH